MRSNSYLLPVIFAFLFSIFFLFGLLLLPLIVLILVVLLVVLLVFGFLVFGFLGLDPPKNLR